MVSRPRRRAHRFDAHCVSLAGRGHCATAIAMHVGRVQPLSFISAGDEILEFDQSWRSLLLIVARFGVKRMRKGLRLKYRKRAAALTHSRRSLRRANKQ